MKLYNYWRSSCSFRVRIALHLKNIPFEYISVHLVSNGGEQFKHEFLAKNPMAQVPVLETDEGHLLAQSTAILLYLEECFPKNPLLPKDPVQKAQVWNWVEMINSGVQPFQNLATLAYVKNNYNADGKFLAQHFIAEGLKAFEASVKATHGRYCLKDELTLAEVCLIPQLVTARRFEVDLENFPTLLEIEKACNALEAFAKSRPENQIDAPEDIK